MSDSGVSTQVEIHPDLSRFAPELERGVQAGATKASGALRNNRGIIKAGGDVGSASGLSFTSGMTKTVDSGVKGKVLGRLRGNRGLFSKGGEELGKAGGDGATKGFTAGLSRLNPFSKLRSSSKTAAAGVESDMKRAGQTTANDLGAGAKKGGASLLSFVKQYALQAAGVVAGLFAVKKIAGFAKSTVSDYKTIGGEVIRIQRYFGGTVQEASKFRFIAQQSGVDADALTRSIGLLSRNLAAGKVDGYAQSLKNIGTGSKDASKATTALAKARQQLSDLEARQAAKTKLTIADEQAKRNALQKVTDAETALSQAQSGRAVATGQILGVSTRYANGSLKPLAKLLPDLSEKFKQMANGPEKTALAMKLFGRSGALLLPFLNKGKAGFAALSKEAEKLGVVLSSKDTEAIKEDTRNQRLYTAAMQGLHIQIGRYVLPVLTKFVGFIVSKMPPVIAFAAKASKRLTEMFRPVVAFVQGAFRLIANGFDTGKVNGKLNGLVKVFTSVGVGLRAVAGFVVGAWHRVTDVVGATVGGVVKGAGTLFSAFSAGKAKAGLGGVLGVISGFGASARKVFDVALPFSVPGMALGMFKAFRRGTTDKSLTGFAGVIDHVGVRARVVFEGAKVKVHQFVTGAKKDAGIFADAFTSGKAQKGLAGIPGLASKAGAGLKRALTAARTDVHLFQDSFRTGIADKTLSGLPALASRAGAGLRRGLDVGKVSLQSFGDAFKTGIRDKTLTGLPGLASRAGAGVRRGLQVGKASLLDFGRAFSTGIADKALTGLPGIASKAGAGIRRGLGVGKQALGDFAAALSTGVSAKGLSGLPAVAAKVGAGIHRGLAGARRDVSLFAAAFKSGEADRTLKGLPGLASKAGAGVRRGLGVGKAAVGSFLGSFKTGQAQKGLGGFAGAASKAGAGVRTAFGGIGRVIGTVVAAVRRIDFAKAFRSVAGLFKPLQQPLHDLIGNLRPLAASILPVLAAAFRGIGKAAGFLGTLLKPLARIIGLVVVVSIKLTVLRIALFLRLLSAGVRGLTIVFRNIVPIVTAFLQPVIHLGSALGKLIHGDFAGFFRQLGAAIRVALANLVRVPFLVGKMVVQLGTALVKGVAPLAGRLLDWVGKAVVKLPGQFARLVVAVGAWALTAGPKIAAKVAILGIRLVGWVGKALLELPGKLAGLLLGIGAWALTAGPKVAAKVLPLAGHLLGWVGKALLDLPGKLGQLIVGIGTWAATSGVTIATKVGGLTVHLLSWVGKALLDLPGKLGGLVVSVGTWVLTAGPKIGAKALGLAGHLLSWVGRALLDLPGKIGRIELAVGSWILDVGPKIGKKALDIAGHLLSFVGEAVRQAPGKLLGFTASIFQFLVDLPGTIGKKVTEIAPKIVSAMLRVGSSIMKGIVDGVTGAVTGAASVAKRLFNAFIGFVNTNIVDKIKSLSVFGGHPFGSLPDFPTLHTGGQINKRMLAGRDEGLALVQSGEGVLPRKAMHKLGPHRFEHIRRGGDVPKFHDGGEIDVDGAGQARKKRRPTLRSVPKFHDGGIFWATRDGNLFGPDDAEDLPLGATRVPAPARGSNRKALPARKTTGKVGQPHGIFWATRSGDLFGPDDAEDIPLWATRVQGFLPGQRGFNWRTMGGHASPAIRKRFPNGLVGDENHDGRISDREWFLYKLPPKVNRWRKAEARDLDDPLGAKTIAALFANGKAGDFDQDGKVAAPEARRHAIAALHASRSHRSGDPVRDYLHAVNHPVGVHEDERGFNWRTMGNGKASTLVKRLFPNGLIGDAGQDGTISDREWTTEKLRRSTRPGQRGFNWRTMVGTASDYLRHKFPNGLIADANQDGRISNHEWFYRHAKPLPPATVAFLKAMRGASGGTRALVSAVAHGQPLEKAIDAYSQPMTRRQFYGYIEHEPKERTHIRQWFERYLRDQSRGILDRPFQQDEGPTLFTNWHRRHVPGGVRYFREALPANAVRQTHGNATRREFAPEPDVPATVYSNGGVRRFHTGGIVSRRDLLAPAPSPLQARAATKAAAPAVATDPAVAAYLHGIAGASGTRRTPLLPPVAPAVPGQHPAEGERGWNWRSMGNGKAGDDIRAAFPNGLIGDRDQNGQISNREWFFYKAGAPVLTPAVADFLRIMKGASPELRSFMSNVATGRLVKAPDGTWQPSGRGAFRPRTPIAVTPGTPPPRFHGGSPGRVRRDHLGGKDEGLALLQSGEGVLPRKAMSRLGHDRFERLRAGHVPMFHDGGIMPASTLAGPRLSVRSGTAEATMPLSPAVLDRLRSSDRSTGDHVEINVTTKDSDTAVAVGIAAVQAYRADQYRRRPPRR